MDGALWDAPPADLAHLGYLPAGFTPSSLAAVADAARAARAAKGNPAQAAREVAWGLQPALPATLIGDAVDLALAMLGED